TPRNGGQANAGEAASSQTATPDSDARTRSGHREVAEICRPELLQLPCDTGQWPTAAGFSGRGQASLAASDTPSRAPAALDLGALCISGQPVASIATNS